MELDLDFARDLALKAVPKPLEQGVVRRSVRLADIPMAPEVGVEFRHRAELENLDLKMEGDQFEATARVAFAVGGSVRSGGLGLGVASCGERVGEPLPAIDFTVRGTVAWAPDAGVAFQPLPWEYRWVRPCELTAFRIRLEDVLDLPSVRGKVEEAVSQAVKRLPEAVRIRPLAEKAWREVSRPRPVLPGIFLLARPESLSLGPLVGHGKKLSTTLNLRASPLLADSVQPSDTSRPLPPVGLADGRDGGFHLEAQVSVPLSRVDSLLTAALAGKVFDAGGRVLRVEKARLYGGGDKAVLGLSLVSPFRGDIFLKGIPQWDSATGRVSLAGLEYDLSTESFLAKSANFLLHGTIVQAISRAAVFDLRARLPRLSDLRIPAGEAGEARVAVESVRPVAISLESDRLRAWLRFEGKASARFGR